MPSRFIDQFDIILIDQGRTFMFENDRFGAKEKFYTLYQSLGGQQFSDIEIRQIVNDLCRYMQACSTDPNRQENFPSIAQAITTVISNSVSDYEMQICDDLIAMLECGTISEHHQNVIHTLSKTHRLGIVSNIWAKSNQFIQNLAQYGILNCFEKIVWSSDHHRIKPSPHLFQIALDHFNTETSRIVFVGDHIRRDVAGAQALGMSAVWIDNRQPRQPMKQVVPNLIINDIEALLTAA